jgi:subfamily B ATP-binding cassette protein MsbA
VDGVDSRNIALTQLRDAVAIVPQKPFLFDLNVEENISLGESKYTNLTIEEVCKLAHSKEFIDQFENGFHQKLGERGNRLSGGQLQRIALARAFYKNSPILVLDEATSALDADNEEKIHDAMEKLIEGKTTFLIAHRFSSLRLADRIIVMDKGEIIADGNHVDLYDSCKLYKTLYDQQNEVLS